jgi:hypothetical protein
MCTPKIMDKVFGIDPPAAPQAPPAPPVVAPPPVAQAPRQPDQAALRSAQAGRVQGKGSPTMLTGSGGVDPALLTIGKNTLLGGG